ncbi:protein of unknown function [Streptantibioticus cattleyicolor NRRL 8057 = DSM 46488]|nr:protein of unknown function [Streptantibioticus cattleyicolor NRRL 8057 = DSM 46488]
MIVSAGIDLAEGAEAALSVTVPEWLASSQEWAIWSTRRSCRSACCRRSSRRCRWAGGWCSRWW